MNEFKWNEFLSLLLFWKLEKLCFVLIVYITKNIFLFLTNSLKYIDCRKLISFLKKKTTYLCHVNTKRESKNNFTKHWNIIGKFTLIISINSYFPLIISKISQYLFLYFYFLLNWLFYFIKNTFNIELFWKILLKSKWKL